MDVGLVCTLHAAACTPLPSLPPHGHVWYTRERTTHSRMLAALRQQLFPPAVPLPPEALAAAAAHLHAAEERLGLRLLSGCPAQGVCAGTYVQEAESVLEQHHQQSDSTASVLQQTASVLRWVSAATTTQHLGEPLQAHCALLRVRSTGGLQIVHFTVICVVFGTHGRWGLGGGV